MPLRAAVLALLAVGLARPAVTSLGGSGAAQTAVVMCWTTRRAWA